MKPKTQYLWLTVLLVLGMVVRLYKITSPIADWHSWRQADTAAVTRNYVKYGVNLLYPRYDDFTDVSGKGLFNPRGLRFVEFPVFNLLHFLFFSSFHTFSLEVWGRLTSVFAALTSSVLLYFIVRRHSNVPTGFLATFFYLFLPYNIYFTRVVLPDPLMVTLFLAALNFNDLKHKNLTVFFGSLAILVKPIAIFFLLPIYFNNFWLGILMLLPFGAWRLWSYRHPEGIPSSLWLLNGNKIRFKPSFFQWIFGVRLGSLILGKWGIWPLLHGVVSLVKPFHLWLIGSLLFVTVFATGSIQHDYYQIPLIPTISVLLALGSYQLWTAKSKQFLNRTILIMSVAFMLAFSWYEIRGLYQINNYPIVLAGQAVDRLTPKDSVVVAPYGGDTAFLYQTNRPGFPYLYMPIKDMIDRYSADYYVSVNYDAETKAFMEKYIVIEQKPEYVIIKLEEPIRP